MPLLRNAAEETALDDAIERAFMLREAGVSAGELGERQEAGRWFAAARDAAASAASPEMRPMAIGLRADAAVAAFVSGDATTALRELARTVEELDGLDPDSSTKAAYCHRVVRHTALWVFRQSSGREVQLDNEPAAMPPGACSNPEPPEDITALPLGPLVVIWHLLAEIEIATGTDAGIQALLPAHLPAGAIPAMEAGLRYAQVVAAIRRRDPRGLVASLGPWVDLQVYFAEHVAEFGILDPMNPTCGTIPVATPEQLRATVAASAAADAVLVFGIAAALQSDSDALVALCEGARQAFDAGHPGMGLAVILAGGPKQGETSEERAASSIHFAAHRQDLDPRELFVVGVQFVRLVVGSNFKGLLAEGVGRLGVRRMGEDCPNAAL